MLEQEFNGKEGDVISMRTLKGHTKKLSLVGIGEASDGYEVKLGESLAKIAKNEKCKTMAVSLPQGADAARIIQVLYL